MAKHSAQILELAKRGAEHRYQELKAELALLVQQFPHLRGGAAHRLGSPAETVKTPIRRRRRVSRDARAKMAAAQTRRWAKVRAERTK